ncbi:MAG: NADP-dependent isocitrate dehydrogenase, partial [Pseudoclavibacter sp.]
GRPGPPPPPPGAARAPPPPPPPRAPHPPAPPPQPGGAREWAEALAAQTEDAELAGRFAPLAERLAEDEGAILGELAGVQGSPVELGGYYWPDPERVDAAMRPSATSTRDLDEFAGEA